jgi:hypothetical protein
MSRPVTFLPVAPLILAAAVVVGTGMGACASGQKLEVKKVDAVAQPPANVALYLKITREDGQPVTLMANDFKVYEDGKAIPPKKVKRALLPVKYAVDRFVLVVVDLSGPLVDSEYLSTMQEALSNLAERIGKDARMGLSAFDGDGIVPFINFEDVDAQPGLVAMRKFRPRTRNIDLWGTFIVALDGLDKAAANSPAPHQQSTLILITDRRDKAGRHSRDEALARVTKSPAEVFVIGIGDGINKEELEPLGKTGALFAEEPRDLAKPLIDLADRIEGRLGQDYLFSYCSPQKIGKKSSKHTVEVRIATTQWHASVEHEFSTHGFTKAVCDPEAKPDFRLPGDKGTEVESESEGNADDAADAKAAGKRKKDKGGKKKAKPVNEEETEAEPAAKS